ncbi:hypothetical protein H0H87_006898 [Tephrocybe sp. NHM501043]|nr:hypothetical protein H0H87_006898 [Tephrocybe sp. NHM501043]
MLSLYREYPLCLEMTSPVPELQKPAYASLSCLLTSRFLLHMRRYLSGAGASKSHPSSTVVSALAFGDAQGGIISEFATSEDANLTFEDDPEDEERSVSKELHPLTNHGSLAQAESSNAVASSSRVTSVEPANEMVNDLRRSLSQASDTTSAEKPFSREFFDKNNAVQRGIYFKVLFGGIFALVLCIFAIFSIFWGALWKTPARNLNGWVIDFDGGLIGQTVAEALSSEQVSAMGKVTWSVVPAAQFPDGLDSVANDVREEKTWAAIAIHAGSTARLQASLATPNASYDGSEAITVYGTEARNENA